MTTGALNHPSEEVKEEKTESKEEKSEEKRSIGKESVRVTPVARLCMD